MQYLEVPTKDTRYVYPTGRIRGLEKYLLKGADFSRIKEEKNLEDSFQNLSRFYPYSESMKVCTSAKEFEKGLEEEWRRTYQELRSFVPEPELIDLFWLDQDFHKIKVFIKLHIKEKDLQEIDKIPYLSRAGTVSLDILRDAIVKDDFFSLPFYFKDLIQQAKKILEKEFSAREIDFFFDRKYFSQFVAGLSKFKDDFLEELAKKLVDEYNIKTFLRIKFREREDEREILEKSLVEGGSVEKDKIVACAGQPVESLLDHLQGGELKTVVQKAIEEWKDKQVLFLFDKSMEEIILRFTSRGFYVTFGREPVINYIFLKKREIKVLRFILQAKKIGLPDEQVELIVSY